VRRVVVCQESRVALVPLGDGYILALGARKADPAATAPAVKEAAER
jgi:hypothetical protein